MINIDSDDKSLFDIKLTYKFIFKALVVYTNYRLCMCAANENLGNLVVMTASGFSSLHHFTDIVP